MARTRRTPRRTSPRKTPADQSSTPKDKVKKSKTEVVESEGKKKEEPKKGHNGRVKVRRPFDIKFRAHMYGILQNNLPGRKISKSAKLQLEKITAYLIEHIVHVMNQFSKVSVTKTVGKKAMYTAIVSAIPGRLGKGAIEAAQNAVESFEHTDPGKRPKDGTKGHSVTRAKRAGLHINVGTVERLYRANLTGFERRRSGVTSVALTGAVEFLIGTILQFAGSQASSSKQSNITDAHLKAAVYSEDTEFYHLIGRKAVMLGGWVGDPAR